MTSAATGALARPVTTLSPRPSPDYVETPSLKALRGRAFNYLKAGFPLHLRGPAGSGKTTLAFHLAAQLERPVMLMVGDEEMSTSDLVGRQSSYQYRKVVDRFIHSVLKYEETANQHWADHRLTTACREGCTLIYDEFTRSRPEANNILLGVLEERLLVMPAANQKDEYIKVHPDFRVIFTSNPQEYAGVHEAQDALSDRMITLNVDFLDEDSEAAIAVARSGLDREAASAIVRLVREFRASGEYEQLPTLRACIMIARLTAAQDLRPSSDDDHFVQICLDVLEGKSAPRTGATDQRASQRKLLLSMIEHHCGAGRLRVVGGAAKTGDAVQA